MAIDNETIEKLIEKAQEAKSKLPPTALDSILNSARLQRLITPSLSNSGLRNCCNFNNNQQTNKGQGPYLILDYKPDADRWEAQSTKNPNEVFLADLTFPGLIAKGFILPGWHNLGEPYGFVQPKRAGKPFEPSSEKEIDKYIEVTITLTQRITGRG